MKGSWRFIWRWRLEEKTRLGNKRKKEGRNAPFLVPTSVRSKRTGFCKSSPNIWQQALWWAWQIMEAFRRRQRRPSHNRHRHSHFQAPPASFPCAATAHNTHKTSLQYTQSTSLFLKKRSFNGESAFVRSASLLCSISSPFAQSCGVLPETDRAHPNARKMNQ